MYGSKRSGYGYGSRYNNYDDYSYFNLDEKKAKRDFMNFADPKTKEISQDGYEKMGKVLGIDIYTDIFITYFVFKCGCKTLDGIKEDEYLNGLRAFKVNTLTDLKSKIMEVRGQLLEIGGDNFKKFYYFLFDLNVPGAENEKKQKSLDYEIVEVYFKSLFTDQFPIVKEFMAYLLHLSEQKKKETGKDDKVGLKWDEWRMFLDFVQNEGTKFPKDYNIASYYPVIVDQFYIWYCKKKGIKVEGVEEDDYWA